MTLTKERVCPKRPREGMPRMTPVIRYQIFFTSYSTLSKQVIVLSTSHLNIQVRAYIRCKPISPPPKPVDSLRISVEAHELPQIAQVMRLRSNPSRARKVMADSLSCTSTITSRIRNCCWRTWWRSSTWSHNASLPRGILRYQMEASFVHVR